MRHPPIGPEDDDPTVRLTAAPRPVPAAPRFSWRIAAPVVAAGLAVVAAGWGAWFALRTPGSAPPVAESRPVVLQPPLLDEAALLAHRAGEPVMLRFAANPAVFVLDFPTLDAQGAALNRVAALLEKAGLPRDRVLSEAELAAAIASAGDTPATYYYGHNYRGAEVQRFFRVATRDAVPLTPAEAWVEAQLRRAIALVPPGTEIALLSIAADGPQFDAAARATILHHELGHGRFATSPGYAAHIRRAWRDRLTEPERAAFRAFLAREGYDTGNDELMLDETQAYLLSTPDPRFFTPAMVGLSDAAVARLRTMFREGSPDPTP